MVNLNGTIVTTEQELESTIADWTDGAKRLARSAFHGTPFEPALSDLKLIKKQAVDKKTKDLISEGFLFDGHIFSLSEAAQINWASIRSNKDMLTFPLIVTADEDLEYQLAEIDVDVFALAAVSTVQGHLSSGRTLKLQIDSATTQSEINAIQDLR